MLKNCYIQNSFSNGQKDSKGIRTALVFTANTPHLACANLMLESLNDKSRGNFKGDIWVITTGLSIKAKNYLDSMGIYYLENHLQEINNWKYKNDVAKAQPEYEELTYEEIVQGKTEEDKIQEAFEVFRNKRMSKLIILDWYKKVGNNYDFVALCDNDLFFQQDLNVLMEKYYSNDPDKLYYWQEENENIVNTWLWKKDYYYSQYHDATELDFGKHEINIGFIMASPRILYEAFSQVKKGFFSLNIQLFTQHSWHDQDLIRLDRAKHPNRYKLIDEGEVVHICNGGMKVIEERYPHAFYNIKTGTMPYVIHFAGGNWKLYWSVKHSYLTNPDDYYFSQILTDKHDVIRTGSFINPFDDTDEKYYTAQNKMSRIKCRKDWLQLSGNGKKKLLFIGWLQTGTHKSTKNAIPGFFFNESYDIAILNGNVTGSPIEDLTEEFPLIIAQLTRITKDPYLVMTYGMRLPWLPCHLYDDVENSAIVEYGCTKRTATAIANLLYLYFSNAIDFYRPDLVCIWGRLSPWGKMIADICAEKGLAVCSVEWGILPGTVSFDFCGHMGESWVAQHSDYFNSLDVSEDDIKKARDYLLYARDKDLSRNVTEELDISIRQKISFYKKSGYSILLFMGSNSAHSGNTLVNPERQKMHAPYQKNDEEIYAELQNLLLKHEDWRIVYKPHPIEITRGLKIDINEENTILVERGSLEEVIDLCDISITLLSQGAYVSVIHQKPCVVVGRLQINDSGAVYTVKGHNQLGEAIQCALLKGYTDTMHEEFVKHVARALKYYVYSANEKVTINSSEKLAESLVSVIEGDQDPHLKYERSAYCKQIESREKVKDTPIVSVIMPVFNAAEYLSESINSILNQSLFSIELICVNNGSTDDSQRILEYFAKKDDRVVLHHQDEPNQREARNWGYRNARGKYVYLIDSDDYLDFYALEKLVDISDRYNADLLYFFFREVKTQQSYDRTRPRWYSYRKFFPKEEVFKLTEEYFKFFIQYPFPWAKLMRREFVLKKELFFDLDCENFDDNPHNLRSLLSSENAYVLNEQLYNFRIHKKSMTQSTNPRIMGMSDAIRIMNDIYDTFGCYEKYAKWYVPYKIHLAAWAWDLVPYEMREDYFYKIKKVFREEDRNYYMDDYVWSFFEMPGSAYLNRVKGFVNLDYNTFISKYGR
ncbi:MAG: glycosyltransferase family 2 protein [Butyrivibrio sp.]|jgi:glycosyltransferase involved in cell wall biosynthesis|nr:glycosyltransferase family 2 protein [Butyrivibrio sp.]